MSLKINGKEYKLFCLGNIFDIKKGKRLTSADQTEGDTIYIGAIDTNNGVSNHIGQSPIHEGNTISLSYNGSVGEAFYQSKPYRATDDVNALYFKKSNNYNFNKYIALFICTIIRKEKYRYNYGRKRTLEKMKTSEIALPIDDLGNPDWKYMENYIKSLHHKTITTKNKSGKFELNVNKWREFLLDNIFDIKKAYAYNKETFEESINGKLPCITRTSVNNGCDYKGETSEDLIIEKGNALTIGGEGAICFYQPNDFVCGTNMTTLRNKYLNKFNGLFLCSIINYYAKGRFNYGRAFNKQQVAKSIIKLPVDSFGNPDREFMENYIKNLPYGDRI